MTKTILVFILQGYILKQDDGKLIDIVTLELIDTTLENAMQRAAKLIPEKKFWRITQVIEKEAQ